VVGGGLLIGATNLPGSCYAELTKPWFNPPNSIFAPAWTILYVLVAIAGWRTFQSAPHSLAMGLWYLQLALNFVWSPVMFTLHAIDLALIVIIVLLVAVFGFCHQAVVVRSGRGSTFCALRRLGFLCHASEFRDLAAQRQQVSDFLIVMRIGSARARMYPYSLLPHATN
jgi:tryptophan-rich sensory protein